MKANWYTYLFELEIRQATIVIENMTIWPRNNGVARRQSLFSHRYISTERLAGRFDTKVASCCRTQNAIRAWPEGISLFRRESVVALGSLAWLSFDFARKMWPLFFPSGSALIHASRATIFALRIGNQRHGFMAHSNLPWLLYFFEDKCENYRWRISARCGDGKRRKAHTIYPTHVSKSLFAQWNAIQIDSNILSENNLMQRFIGVGVKERSSTGNAPWMARIICYSWAHVLPRYELFTTIFLPNLLRTIPFEEGEKNISCVHPHFKRRTLNVAR